MKTIKIGEQVWSTSNLKVDHYRNGDVIPQVQDKDEWANTKEGAWCYFKNKKKKKHGKLYNWYAVNDPRGLAPEGWHIPSKKEFETLVSAVKDDGNSLKSEGVGEGNGVGTNKSGFSALLSGYRNYDGSFGSLGYYTYYWSSTAYNGTNAYNLHLFYCNSNTLLNHYFKESSFSIRLIKD